MVRPKVYLAGPDVFHPKAVAIGERKKALCAAHDCDGLFPLDNAVGPIEGDGASTAARIYDANIAMIERSDAVIANVTPFMGAGADDGTAFEIGYAAARGLPLALYDNGCGDTAAKAAQVRAAAPGLCGDLQAEEFGLPVNLMLAIPALRRAPIAAGPEPLPLDDLTRFEVALRALLALLRRGG